MIDAHHHLWDPVRGDYPWMPASGVLRRPYLLPELAAMREATRVDRTVVVQAAPTLAESEFLMTLAGSDDRIAGVVGWVDLDQPVERVVADLDRLAALGPLVGVRPMIQDIDDPTWISREHVQRGLALLADRQLTFDLLCREDQLPRVVDGLAGHDALTVAVDHLAKPDYTRVTSTWLDGMTAVAQLPNGYCKLGGMVTEVSVPDTAAFQEHVGIVLERFGPSRCMYGSDWPVCLTAAEPDRVHLVAEELTSHLRPDEAEYVWGRAAQACYRIDHEGKR